VTTLEVVEAGDADVHDLARLFDAYRVFYGRSSGLERAHDFVTERLRSQVTRFFIAKTNGVAIGFVHLLPSFDTLAMRPMWILEDLFVDPAQRRQGAGSALLRQAEQFARESHASKLSLTTAKSNDLAQRLYVAHGYRRDELFWTYHRILD